MRSHLSKASNGPQKCLPRWTKIDIFSLTAVLKWGPGVDLKCGLLGLFPSTYHCLCRPSFPFQLKVTFPGCHFAIFALSHSLPAKIPCPQGVFLCQTPWKLNARNALIALHSSWRINFEIRSHSPSPVNRCAGCVFLAVCTCV